MIHEDLMNHEEMVAAAEVKFESEGYEKIPKRVIIPEEIQAKCGFKHTHITPDVLLQKKKKLLAVECGTTPEKKMRVYKELGIRAVHIPYNYSPRDKLLVTKEKTLKKKIAFLEIESREHLKLFWDSERKNKSLIQQNIILHDEAETWKWKYNMLRKENARREWDSWKSYKVGDSWKSYKVKKRK